MQMDCNMLGAWWFEYIIVFQNMELLQGSCDQLWTFLMLSLTWIFSIQRFIINVYTIWTRNFLMYFETNKTKRRTTWQDDVDILHKSAHYKTQLPYPPFMSKKPKSQLLLTWKHFYLQHWWRHYVEWHLATKKTLTWRKKNHSLKDLTHEWCILILLRA